MRDQLIPILALSPHVESESNVAAVVGEVLGEPIDLNTNARVMVITEEKSISIDTIRRLPNLLATAPAGTEPTIVVIWPAGKITLPAQHALLKLLEEPPPRSQFVLVAHTQNELLSTIASRCLVRMCGISDKSEEQSPHAALWPRLSACNSWRAVVDLSQQLPVKKEEQSEFWRRELQLELPLDEAAVRYRALVLEAWEGLQNNVSPMLCAERVVLGWWQRRG